MSEDIFIKITSSKLSVGHEFKIFKMKTFLKINISLMLVSKSGNEWLDETVELSGETIVAKIDSIDLGVFITILLEIFPGSGHFTTAVEYGGIDQLFVGELFKSHHD